MRIEEVIGVFLSLKKNSGLTYGSQSRIAHLIQRGKESLQVGSKRE